MVKINQKTFVKIVLPRPTGNCVRCADTARQGIAAIL